MHLPYSEWWGYQKAIDAVYASRRTQFGDNSEWWGMVDAFVANPILRDQAIMAAVARALRVERRWRLDWKELVPGKQFTARIGRTSSHTISVHLEHGKWFGGWSGDKPLTLSGFPDAQSCCNAVDRILGRDENRSLRAA